MDGRPGSANVFEDLFPQGQAKNLKIRSELMIRLRDFIREKGSTQEEASDRMDVSQSRISELLNGKIGSFTIDALVMMCEAAGIPVELHLDDSYSDPDT